MRPFTFSRQWPRGFLVEGTSIVAVDQASLSDRKEVEKLIAEYHASERITPIKERISWAVDQNLLGESPGLLLVAREKDMILGVAVYTPSEEIVRAITAIDFFVRPEHRRDAEALTLAKRLA